MYKLKIVFAGTSYFSAQHLLKLINSNYSIIGVITKPDRPVGRGKKIKFSEVKILALKYNIPILQTESFFKKNYLDIIKKIFLFKIDLMIVVSYGVMIPKYILNILKFGAINIHPSLLPRWRGATPIQQAILKGDKKTGITIISMNEKIDAGDILYQKSCKIEYYDTSATLSKKLKNIGCIAMLYVINQVINNKLVFKKQDISKIKISKKINKKDAKINWNKKASYIEKCIRAFNPWPISYFYFNMIMIKVWTAYVIKENSKKTPGTIIYVNKFGIQVVTKKYILNITEIQLPGKNKIYIKNFLNSKRDFFSINDILS